LLPTLEKEENFLISIAWKIVRFSLPEERT
jgi:hypothetical protein